MEQWEKDQIRTDANILFSARRDGKIPMSVSFCRRCMRMLDRCECIGKCENNKHTKECACLDLVNIAYRIAHAELKATREGFVV